MEKIIIRKARENELETIQDLNYQLFQHDEEFDSSLNMNWPFEKIGHNYFRIRITGKEGICLVAEVDGQIVGYLAGAMIKPYSYRKIKKQAELENTLVKEDFRGQGIGEDLFREFINWSKKQGAERIKVTASAENQKAIKFYKRVGFASYTAELEYEIK